MKFIEEAGGSPLGTFVRVIRCFIDDPRTKPQVYTYARLKEWLKEFSILIVRVFRWKVFDGQSTG